MARKPSADALVPLSTPAFAPRPLSSIHTTGLDSRPIRLRDPQAHQARAREGHLHLCGRDTSPNRGSDERDLRGAQVSGRIRS